VVDDAVNHGIVGDEGDNPHLSTYLNQQIHLTVNLMKRGNLESHIPSILFIARNSD